jgi:hypothetical protein
LEGIEFSKFDTLYYDDYSDGSEYKFHIKRNNLEKTIYLNSLNPPKELDSLATWIYLTKRKLKLVKTNKSEIYRSKIPMPEPPPLFIDNN